MAASIPACSFGTVTALKSPTLPLFLGVHFHTILGLPLPFTEPSKRAICFKPTAPRMNNASPANRVRQRSRVKNNHQTSSRGIDTTIVNIVCMFLNMLSRSPDMRTRTTFATASATLAIGIHQRIRRLTFGFTFSKLAISFIVFMVLPFF